MMAADYNRPLPVKGQKYKHFKGMIITVIGVAEHTETGEVAVVYEHGGDLWCRPLSMFLGRVDRNKYPDAKQWYRFELVNERSPYAGMYIDRSRV